MVANAVSVSISEKKSVDRKIPFYTNENEDNRKPIKLIGYFTKRKAAAYLALKTSFLQLLRR